MSRLALLVIAVFLLFTTRFAEGLGVLLTLGAVLAGGRAAFRGFRRDWTGSSRRSPQRVKPLVPIAVDRDDNTRCRNTGGDQ